MQTRLLSTIVTLLPFVAFPLDDAKQSPLCTHGRAMITTLKSCKDKKSCASACEVIQKNPDAKKIANTLAYINIGMPMMFDNCDHHLHQGMMYKFIIEDLTDDMKDECIVQRRPKKKR